MADPDLLVSVVNYQTTDLLDQCLGALEAERAAWGEALEVVVSDNGSGDASSDLVRASYPRVRLIQHDRNLGFGAAHNLALSGARARYLLVLNSDAVVQPGSLRHLVDFLEATPDVGIVGPRLRYPNGTIQPSRRRFPTLATFLLESTQVQRFWPSNPVRRRYLMADMPEAQTQDVDWLVGAALCVRARAARDLGLFDERYFLYSEEVDWCRRFRAAGWRVVYLPAAEVAHLEGGTSRRDLLARDLQFHQSRRRYMARWHGETAAAALQTYVLAEYLARGVEESVKLALGSRLAERRARLRVIGGFLRYSMRRRNS